MNRLSSIKGAALVIILSVLSFFQVVVGQEAKAPSQTQAKVEPEVPIRIQELFRMLDHPFVQKELELSESQLSALAKIKADSNVNDILRANMGKSKSAETKATIEQKIKLPQKSIEELLTPQQFTRLKQLCVRMEISAIGLSEALLKGRLAVALGIEQPQAAELSGGISKILDDLEQSLRQLNEKAESRILSELAPEQQARAKDALGDFFQYRIYSIQQTLVELEFRHNQKLLKNEKQ